jgi:two-component system, chemotaxis family, chemotaxis protein CheY
MNKDMKVLIVDDFSTLRRIIKNLLRELGFTSSVEADDEATALPILKSGGVDFLITDWNVTNMPGIDLLHQVRSDDALKRIPVMMVTAEGSCEQIMQAAGAGVNGYIVKPFTPQTLPEKSEQIFQRVESAGL